MRTALAQRISDRVSEEVFIGEITRLRVQLIMNDVIKIFYKTGDKFYDRRGNNF
jgi:hypothetical protein